MDYREYIVKRDSRTDMLSSLKKLNKKTLKNSLKINYCETVKDLARYSIRHIKGILDECHDDLGTHIFFTRLIDGEGGPLMVPYDSDIRTFVVFIYEKDNYLTYYIPDEIKKIIEKFLA